MLRLRLFALSLLLPATGACTTDMSLRIGAGVAVGSREMGPQVTATIGLNHQIHDGHHLTNACVLAASRVAAENRASGAVALEWIVARRRAMFRVGPSLGELRTSGDDGRRWFIGLQTAALYSFAVEGASQPEHDFMANLAGVGDNELDARHVEARVSAGPELSISRIEGGASIGYAGAALQYDILGD